MTEKIRSRFYKVLKTLLCILVFSTNFPTNFLAEDFHLLSVSTNNAELGTVHINEDLMGIEISTGENATFYATPNQDNIFDHWELNGENISTDNPFTYTVPSSEDYNLNIKAIFIGYPKLVV